MERTLDTYSPGGLVGTAIGKPHITRVSASPPAQGMSAWTTVGLYPWYATTRLTKQPGQLV